METAALCQTYRGTSELLLSPSDRDPTGLERLERALESAPPGVRDPVYRFLDAPAARSLDEYTQTLELSPPCPLYAGTYLFDEPTSCRGAGTSGRNGYMIELVNVYRHFGLELGHAELPDFLPLMVEFCALSLERRELDRIGLRRRFIVRQLQPALDPLATRLASYESVYEHVIRALDALVALDLAHHAGSEWLPPEGERPIRRTLPIVSSSQRREQPL